MPLTTFEQWTQGLQAAASVLAAIGLGCTAYQICQTNQSLEIAQKQAREAQRTNELEVLPFIVATRLNKSTAQHKLQKYSTELKEPNDYNSYFEYIEISNLFDKPALNVRTIVFEKKDAQINNKSEDLFFFADNEGSGEQSYQYMTASDVTKGKRINRFNNTTKYYKSKQEVEVELKKLYGNKVEKLFNNIKDSNYDKSSIYVFFEDLNGDIRLAIRDYEVNSSNDGFNHFNHFYRKVEVQQ